MQNISSNNVSVSEINKIEKKRGITKETFVALIVLIVFFGGLGYKMGVSNMLNTLMNTAYQLLMDTVFYIMGIAVLTGALSAIFTEFGITSLVNKLLSPLMKLLYNLPGVSALGIVTTYMSDNPAILTLSDNENFKKYFEDYQFPAITNLGTSFGMGLIITTFMIGIKSPTGESFILPVLVGNLGAVIGSIVSVRIMLRSTKKFYKVDKKIDKSKKEEVFIDEREIRSGSIFSRCLTSILEGGKSGLDMGLSVIPGILIICTIVLILTNGPADNGLYTGTAYEGIGLLPYLGDKISFILKPLFGFSSSSAIAIPITALGAAGAAIGLVPSMISNGLAGANDIAVFTSMCMCWSGYLSTHVAMMDSIKCTKLTGNAIFAHTIGGLMAGISSNIIYQIITAVIL